MNVVFLDFDGEINTYHDNSREAIENRIKILSEICNDYNCKVVIEASIKREIDEETLETSIEWVKEIFDLFKKYNIDCIGRTPVISKKINSYSEIPIWKEDEIELYLSNHPEINHYCVIDDDDLAPNNSDLNKVRDHLVKTMFYSSDSSKEGLLEEHKEVVGKIIRR